jgi:hypothetical protein
MYTQNFYMIRVCIPCSSRGAKQPVFLEVSGLCRGAGGVLSVHRHSFYCSRSLARLEWGQSFASRCNAPLVSWGHELDFQADSCRSQHVSQAARCYWGPVGAIQPMSCEILVPLQHWEASAKGEYQINAIIKRLLSYTHSLVRHLAV